MAPTVRKSFPVRPLAQAVPKHWRTSVPHYPRFLRPATRRSLQRLAREPAPVRSRELAKAASASVRVEKFGVLAKNRRVAEVLHLLVRPLLTVPLDSFPQPTCP